MSRLPPLARCAAALSLALVALAGGSAASATAAGEALVKFRPGASAALVAAAHARAGARVVGAIAPIGYQRVRIDPSLPLETALASYRSDPIVAVAEPNHVVRLAAASDDPCRVGVCAGVRGQWALAMTNAESAWDGFLTAAQKRSAPRVTVAVVDTKLDATHPDFANPGSPSPDAADGGQLDLAGARDWVPASAQSGAARYHGSYVAGLVAAATNNAAGVAGLGFRATILPLTVVDGTGRADAASLADAIVYAHARGARVINLSLGLAADSSAVRDAIRSVTSGANPSLVVAAAGNNTGSAPFYPGSYPEVLSVAGTGAADAPAVCSNHNANVSVSAPAERVVSLDVGGGFVAPPCGTSAAAPQVSALAALLFAQDPGRTPADVRRIVEAAADDLGPLGRDDRFGHGRINAERALRAGPKATLARATVASGGASTITATASAPRGIHAARVRLGSPEAEPASLAAADGAFGDAAERLTGSLPVPAGTPAGPHPIFVQAFDGISWGPSTVGVLLVDGRAPTISGASASGGVRASGQPVTVAYTVADDASPALATGIQVFDPQNRIVHQAAQPAVPAGPVRFAWTPPLSALPGPYQVKIVAADASGRSSAVLVGTIVA